MQRGQEDEIMRKRELCMVVVILAICVSIWLGAASAEGAPRGQEDLSGLTYTELVKLISDIDAEIKADHEISSAQRDHVLDAVKRTTEACFQQDGLSISGWAWFDHEYTYTKDWDHYTLKTHVDYKDKNNRSQQAVIYGEVRFQSNEYVAIYLSVDGKVRMDEKDQYNGQMWSSEPKKFVNESTLTDLAQYTRSELETLKTRAGDEIQRNHSVPDKVSSLMLAMTKSEIEQYCIQNSIDITSYAWYDSEYTYYHDWDLYQMESHIDIKAKTKSATGVKYTSSICKIGDRFELIELRIQDHPVVDKWDQITADGSNGTKKYSWKAPDRTNADRPEPTPTIIYVTPAPTQVPDHPTVTPEPVYVYITPEPAEDAGEGFFNVNLAEATDETLAAAKQQIEQEQRARIKTKIILSSSHAEIFVGKTMKIEASITGLPEGEKTPKLEWSTSDKAVATCSNGTVRAVAGGSAVITCSAQLADGTRVYEECTVKVNIPVSSINTDKKALTIKGGQSDRLSLVVKPENASNKALVYESSDTKVVTVDEEGVLTGVGDGNAKITVTAADGSDRKLTVSVKVVDYRISLETAKKVVMTGIGNQWALDNFTADGMYYDKRKFHPYSHFDGWFTEISEGNWSTQDGGNTWHIEGYLLRENKYGGYYEYRLDVRYDGKNYYVENGWL